MKATFHLSPAVRRAMADAGPCFRKIGVECIFDVVEIETDETEWEDTVCLRFAAGSRFVAKYQRRGCGQGWIWVLVEAELWRKQRPADEGATPEWTRWKMNEQLAFEKVA